MFLEKPNNEMLLDCIAEQNLNSSDLVLIMLGQKCCVCIPQLLETLGNHKIMFMGGVFPFVIHENCVSEEGAIIKIIPNVHSFLVLSPDDSDLKTLKQLDLSPIDQKFTALILSDGFSPLVSEQLSNLFTYLGNSVNYLGGGAGDMTDNDRPCLFCSQGMVKDSTLVCITKQRISLGVRHGWTRVSGPFLATKTFRNTIEELNWENAFEIYQKKLSQLGYSTIAGDNFFEIAKRFPFGIYKERSEFIVRDPFSVNEAGYIECVGDIPENTLLDLLSGDKESLCEAARKATEDCLSVNENGKELLIFNCISRALFLEDQFNNELEGIIDQIGTMGSSLPLEGVLSVGEISSLGEGYLELLNKTVVIGLFHN